MAVWMRYLVCGLALGWAPAALAQHLLPDTNCAVANTMFHQDPYAPGVQTQSEELNAWVMKYLPAGASAATVISIMKTMIPGVIAYCAGRPHATVGEAVDQVAQQAHLAGHDVLKPHTTSLIVENPNPQPANVPPDEATLAAVTLFRQTCLGLDSTAALRAWANTRHLPMIPPNLVPLESLGKPGLGFVVGGTTMLMSLDSGDCQVVSHFGVLERYETALQTLAETGSGFTIRARTDRIDPQNDIVQRLYDWEGRAWSQDVLVVAKPNEPPQPHGPTIVLQASARHGGI